ncbi:LOW QUALITY PROTEIN: protein kinase C delta type-like [Anomaloglossus baeobatrachus]
MEEDIKKKKRIIGPNARELEDEEPRAELKKSVVVLGPSTAITPISNSQLDINDYKFHQVLGEGSFGQVVLASVCGQNIYKAIKIIDKQDNAKALRRERRILLAARDCPFVSHLDAALQSQSEAYFIMEYLSGGSLESLIKMSGKLNIETTRFITAELICGLQFLHGHGIAHRDIKPANIMLDKDGHARIIDLGVAKDGLTASKKIYGRTGTFHYMAPEVLLEKSYTAAVDWWSLGIVVSKMSTGRSPFYNGPQKQAVYKSITTERPKFPTWLDVDVKHLIKKLLRKNPETRLGVSGNIRDHPFWDHLLGGTGAEESTAPLYTFPSCSGVNHLDWPEDKPPLHPVSDYSFFHQAGHSRMNPSHLPRTLCLLRPLLVCLTLACSGLRPSLLI